MGKEMKEETSHSGLELAVVSEQAGSQCGWNGVQRS